MFLLYYFNHLGDDYPEQSIQQRPLCPPTALQHIDPLPTDVKSYTNITWDYKSTLVRAWGALTWLFALSWELSKRCGTWCVHISRYCLNLVVWMSVAVRELAWNCLAVPAIDGFTVTSMKLDNCSRCTATLQLHESPANVILELVVWNAAAARRDSTPVTAVIHLLLR